MKSTLKIVAALALSASFFTASAQGDGKMMKKDGKMADGKMMKKDKMSKGKMKSKMATDGTAAPATAPAATPAPKM